MRKTLLTMAINTALLSSLAFSVQASTEPQGMYSADDIMDADVFSTDNPDEEIGEVEDILFDEEMRISAIVVESGLLLGLGGREIVVESGQFTLETTTEDDGDTEHRIMLDSSVEEVESLPTYDTEWWETTKSNARDAWQSTREGAQSAWQTTREAVDSDE